MEDVKYYVVQPSIKLFGGIKVTKETKFDTCNDDKTVHQTMKNLVLTTEVNRTSDYNGIKSTEKSVMTTEVPEGTVLIWGEQEGYIIPQYKMVRVEEAIAEYERQAAIYQKNGENEKNLELWERAYAEFPNDCRAIEGLMFAINREAIYPCPKDKAERIISLGEKLLQKTTDARQRENALQCLCYTYDGIDKEKALYYADMCGGFYVTREGLRAIILDGEDGVKACQSYIDSLIHTAAMTALRMTAKISFSHEEKIEAFRFAIDIMERLYADGNVGFCASYLSLFYSMIASEYAQMHDSQKTLDALTESCRYAVIEANLKDMDYTAPMVNRLKYKKADTSKNYKGNACNLRLKALENRQFDFVREEDAFKKLIVMLEQNAE